jgi:uncharacterized protein
MHTSRRTRIPPAIRNERRGEWELDFVEGRAFLSYDESDGMLTLLHTEVPPELEGHGVGSALVRTALEYARARSLRVLHVCSFAAAYLKRHPDEVPGSDDTDPDVW